jgi:hypothetical protein
LSLSFRAGDVSQRSSGIPVNGGCNFPRRLPGVVAPEKLGEISGRARLGG